MKAPKTPNLCQKCGKKTNKKVCNVCVGLVMKSIKEAEKQKKEEKVQLKEKLSTKKQTYVAKVNKIKVVFQAWIRERDKNEPCISCGAIKADQWHGGHLYKAENYSGLIFDERNCRKQCRKCNIHLQGNQLEYFNNMKIRFGEKFMEQLRLDAYLTKVKTWSDEELKEIKEKYKL